jgi:hypothetical protein
MLEELVKTVRLHLSERLTSPLLGAFVVSWTAWNYRFFLVVLSGASVHEKFYLIDKVVFPGGWETGLKVFILPLFTALLYLFVYPFPAKKVYEFTRKRQREILDIRRQIEGETPLTVEDSRRVRTELAKAEQNYFSELDRKDREIEKLKGQIQATLEIIQQQSVSSIGADSRSALEGGQSPEPVAVVDDDEEHADEFDFGLRMQPVVLSDAQFAFLHNIAENHRGVLYHREAVKVAGVSRVEAEYAIGELLRLEFIESTYDEPRQDFGYSFTHAGRAAYLRRLKLIRNVDHDM